MQYVSVSVPWNEEQLSMQLYRLLIREGFEVQFLPVEWLREPKYAPEVRDIEQTTGCVVMLYDGYAMGREALQDLMQLDKSLLLVVREESLLAELEGVSAPLLLWSELMLDAEPRRDFLRRMARHAERCDPLCTDQVSFRLEMTEEGGSLTMHSADACSITDDVWYRMSAEEWHVFAGLIRQVTAYLLGIGEDEVTVTPDEPVAPAYCAPEDGKVYYYEGYRIFFGIRTARPPQRPLYNGFEISTLLGCVSLEPHRDGRHIFRSLPEHPTLADVGLDGETLRDLTLPVMQFMHPLQQVSAAPAFEVEMYSDGSGSFRMPCTIT